MERKMEFIAKNFSEAPKDDLIVCDFSCSLQREVITQGRIYFSYHGFYFHSNILGFVKYCSGLWKNVKEVKKDKVAYVLPVLIHIKTNDEKFSFSFLQGRDKVYILSRMLWFNHIRGEPEDKEVIYRKSVLLTNNDLEISKGELDYLSSDQSDSTDLCSISSLPKDTLSTQDVRNHDLELDTLPSISSENQIPTILSHVLKDDSLPKLDDMHAECNCEGEDYKEILANDVFSNIETVRSLLFDEYSPVLSNLMSTLNLQNFKIENVPRSNSTDQETKVITYLYPIGFPFPSASTHSTYIFIHSPPWNSSHTSVVCDSYSQNVTYSDSFHVLNKYCFSKKSNECTSIRIFSKIEFLKKIPSPIKSLITTKTFIKTTEYMNTLIKLLQTHLIKSSHDPTIMPDDILSVPMIDKAQSQLLQNSQNNSTFNIRTYSSILHNISEYAIALFVYLINTIWGFDLMMYKDILIIALILSTFAFQFKMMNVLFDTLKKQQEFLVYTTEHMNKIMEKFYCSK